MDERSEVAGLGGLEPSAYGLETRCSVQLSYRPKQAKLRAAGLFPRATQGVPLKLPRATCSISLLKRHEKTEASISLSWMLLLPAPHGFFYGTGKALALQPMNPQQ